MTDMSVTLPVRERLLTAATEVFASKGYTATRVSDIVQQAGVAQGTFYLYFKSKQAILEQLIDTFCSRLLADTLETFHLSERSRPEDLMAQARLLWRTVLQRCREERALMQLALREPSAAGPEVVARLQAHYQRVIDGLATYIQAAEAKGLCRPVHPQLTAWAIFGMLERAVYYAVLVDEQADLDQVADDLVRLELGGLLVDGWEEIEANRGEQQ
jgi:AcrR family transcriptional regulator